MYIYKHAIIYMYIYVHMLDMHICIHVRYANINLKVMYVYIYIYIYKIYNHVSSKICAFSDLRSRSRFHVFSRLFTMLCAQLRVSTQRIEISPWSALLRKHPIPRLRGRWLLVRCSPNKKCGCSPFRSIPISATWRICEAHQSPP